MFDTGKKDSNNISILSIDPGTNHLGIAVINIDAKEMTITSSHAQSYSANRSGVLDKDIADIHGEKLARLMAQKENLKRVLREVRPFTVACEAPFYFHKRPGAFAPLVEVSLMIRLAVYEYNSEIKLYTYDPSSVKKAVGAMGNSDKQAVKNKVLNLKEIKCPKQELELLDEHSVDALAVGYCHYMNTVLAKPKPIGT